MSILITESKTPLEPDTLGAIKISEFHGDITPLYSYFRIYCYDGGLNIGLKLFERVDIARNKITFMITTQDEEKVLFAELENNKQPICYLNSAKNGNDINSPHVTFISGDDNQGYYWGAEFRLSSEQLNPIGLKLKAGVGFLANIMITNSFEEGYGVAYKTKDEFCDFLIVPY